MNSAAKDIEKDVNEVFEEIRQDIQKNYFVSGKHDLSYIRQALVEHLPKIIINKNLLLIDTLSNYLTKYVLESIGNVEDKIVNSFYQWNRKQIELLKSDFKINISSKEISLPYDLSKLGIIAGIGGVGGAFAILPLSTGLAAPLAAGIGFATYKIFKKQYSQIAIKQVEKDITKWIQEEKKDALRRLQHAIDIYEDQKNKLDILGDENKKKA